MRTFESQPHLFKRFITFVSAFAMMLCLTPSLSPSAAAETAAKVYEAENGILSEGLTIQNSVPGYSGTGYVGDFTTNSQNLTFKVEVPETALYTLSIVTGPVFGPGKVGNIEVNGTSAGTFTMGSSDFSESSAGNILLNQGVNTITITPNWTWFRIDSIKITPAPVPLKSEVQKKLINPNSTKEARALLSYLADNFGNHILSGQQEYPNSNLKDTNTIYQNTGKYPAVLGLDFIDNSPSRVERGTSADEVKTAIDWWNNGGILTFTWHWNAPKDLLDTPEHPWWSGFYTDATRFDVAYALNHPDSEDYRLLIRDIDAISSELKRLQNAGVPVLWRPLHEAEGKWFWWGAKGPEATKKLWKLMYDRMTTYHKLNNLIWVWNSIDAAWYPGDEYVDIVSFDSYPGAFKYGPQSSQYEALVRLSSNKKIVAMAENGPIPDPDLLPVYHANYSWFNTWNGMETTENNIAHLQKVYNHDYVITRDELPPLKTYLEDTQIARITKLVDQYAKSGELSGPLLAQVSNNFDTAVNFYHQGNKKQAMKHLQDLQKHLNNEALENHVSDKAKQDLLENTNALIELLSE
jgi:mannan endo-1,4-beta-mannosidase